MRHGARGRESTLMSRVDNTRKARQKGQKGEVGGRLVVDSDYPERSWAYMMSRKWLNGKKFYILA